MEELKLSEAGGTYRLLTELGSGGMADVFLALAEKGGVSKLQVVKRLKANLSDDPEFVEMFLDEARLGARLNHPNVVQTHEVGSQGGRYFIVMDHLDGQPFSRLRAQHERKTGKPLPLDMSMRILGDVLRALEYAHNLADFDGTPLDIVHRDVSPQNVFVTYDGVVKLVDFGVAKAALNSVETRTGVIKGKLTYMAPEQVRSADELDRRADVFSVGVMLHEALTGQRMWKGIPDVTVMSMLLEGRTPPLPETAPKALRDVASHALSLAANERFATAGLFALALETAHPKAATQEELSALVRGLFQEERERSRVELDLELRKARGVVIRNRSEQPGDRPSSPTGTAWPRIGELPPPRLSGGDLARSVPGAPIVPHFSERARAEDASSAPPAVEPPRKSATPFGGWFIGVGVAVVAFFLGYVSLRGLSKDEARPLGGGREAHVEPPSVDSPRVKAQPSETAVQPTGTAPVPTGAELGKPPLPTASASPVSAESASARGASTLGASTPPTRARSVSPDPSASQGAATRPTAPPRTSASSRTASTPSAKPSASATIDTEIRLER